MSERGGLWPEDDADFMFLFRRTVDEFLVLGVVPPDGDTLMGRGLRLRDAMRENIGQERHDLLRRSIIEMRPYAKELATRARANAVLKQDRPPAAVHVFDAVTSNPLRNEIPKEEVLDVIDHTIGVIRSGMLGGAKAPQRDVSMRMVKVKGFVFIAMPMFPDDPHLEDVHHAIKDVARDLGLEAERVDDPTSNDRITDRVLKSLAEAEFIVADLTHARPNVYFEAGVAQGHGKVPIYIAREGTRIEFDLKDYPVIFFKNNAELRGLLTKRLSGLVKDGP